MSFFIVIRAAIIIIIIFNNDNFSNFRYTKTNLSNFHVNVYNYNNYIYAVSFDWDGVTHPIHTPIDHML